jgi:hypothetical protein
MSLSQLCTGFIKLKSQNPFWSLSEGPLRIHLSQSGGVIKQGVGLNTAAECISAIDVVTQTIN